MLDQISEGEDLEFLLKQRSPLRANAFQKLDRGIEKTHA
jgi:hypothetical protein